MGSSSTIRTFFKGSLSMQVSSRTASNEPISKYKDVKIPLFMHRGIIGNLRAKREPDAEQTSNILILTGAGISAESGVATFRDKDGIWSKVDYRRRRNARRILRETRRSSTISITSAARPIPESSPTPPTAHLPALGTRIQRIRRHRHAKH